ncbi:MAG: hypothetical protein DI533_10770 [Cereibacter sphaeroides]|uniref:Enoyl reductase (ER) domain-containing protein n=1 Tax=Cereibacter sphaeroides TaxID=1063 RepID=A0A2W5S3K4_CERSP|nr:MAG: hypothetical protein DI533_10770 [Cereibacter sphaeroides]
MTNMKAAILNAAGTPVWGEIERPAATADTALVKVALAGVNPIDLQLAAGSAGPFPQVPGREGVGLIGGRRVYFSAAPGRFGSMAEESLAIPARTFDVPDELDNSRAVALGIGGLTGWLALSDRAKLQRGETVVVLGASGIVGSIAVQAARLLGAGRIIAAARSAKGLEAARALGADATVALDSDDAELLATRFRDASGGRIDVIVDPLWGVPALGALKAATAGARLVQLGHSAGAVLPLSPGFMRGPQSAILGFSSGGSSVEVRAEAYGRLCAAVLSGDIKFDTRILPLSAVAEAWAVQAASPNLKLCLNPSA